MEKIVTICKKHGEITKSNAKKVINKKRKWIGYRCNICVKHQKTKKYFTSEIYQKNKIIIKDPENARKRRLKSYFNITIDDYNKILNNQNNCCAICRKPENANSSFNKNIKKMAVDHCHKSNKIRGILCHRCNMGLGYFKDSIERLQSAIEYLKLNP